MFTSFACAYFSILVIISYIYSRICLTIDIVSTRISRIVMLTKEGWLKQVLSSYHEQKQALNRFFLGAMILTDSVLDVLRRELKRACPDVKIHNEQIQDVLLQEVLKREVVEGERAEEARKKIARAASRQLRNRSLKEEQSSAIAPPSTVAAVTQTPAQASPCQQPAA